MGLFKCAAYLAAAGAASFVLGRAGPPAWFREPRGPFRCFPFEQEGRLYERAGVKRWQGKLPDMSRILPGALPPKRVGPDGARDLSEMVRETCVAELAHWALCLAGLPCLWLWPGAGGAVVAAAYAAGNVPFILAQRYNRPRLVRLEEKRRARRAAARKEALS